MERWGLDGLLAAFIMSVSLTAFTQTGVRYNVLISELNGAGHLILKCLHDKQLIYSIFEVNAHACVFSICVPT